MTTRISPETFVKSWEYHQKNTGTKIQKGESLEFKYFFEEVSCRGLVNDNYKVTLTTITLTG